MKTRLLALFCVLSALPGLAQDNHIYGSIGVGGNFISTPDHVPFWLRSNRFGETPLPGSSGSVYGEAHKYYDTLENPLIDWAASIQARVNIGERTNATLIEGYIKMAISEFEIKVGRSKDVIGLMDTTLSSGSFSMSGNALGVPKVEISIPSYYSIPGLGGILGVKGNFSLGMMGEFPVQYLVRTKLNTFLHQKSLYFLFGKPDWRVHLFGGFNHQVMFGGEKVVFPGYPFNAWETFTRVAEGRTWQYSKIGNHIGSIDMAFQYDFNDVRVFIYRQNFYDEGALAHLANIQDGLNGISVVNTSEYESKLKWKKFLVEFFYSKDQAGYPWSIRTKSGDENYYNNYQYAEGWSYKQAILGNPLVSSRNDTRPFINDPSDFFNNNRIVAVNLGTEFNYAGFDFRAKFTASRNYGTFGTSVYGHTTGAIVHTSHGVFPVQNQYSGLLQISKVWENGYSFAAMLAVDHGGLLYDSQGLEFKLMKSL